MQEQTFRHLIDNYLSGNINDKDRKLLDDFLSSYQGSSEWHGELGDKELKKEALLRRIKTEIGRNEKRRSVFYYTRRIAASILVVTTIAIGIWNFTQVSQKDLLIVKTTQLGQKSNIVLSDGTHIKLNSGSSITYPKRFNGDIREVYLEGEAFFEVVKNPDKPFIVKTKNLTTQVLGTSFNVSDFVDQDASVTVATGKVRVSKNVSGEKVMLLPGMQVKIYDGKMISKEVDLEKSLAWKKGIIHFDKIPLKDAVLILERWYNINIELSNELLGNCVIRGKYKEENLVNILESLRFVQEISYEFADSSKVIITGDGCETY